MSDDLDLEITAMQTDWLIDNRRNRRWIVVQKPDGRFSIHQHTVDGVAPQSDYATTEEASSRLLQLLGIKRPVTPQSWPEEVCIGYVDTEDHERHPVTP